MNDFDADGSPEILAGSSRGPLLLSANGTVDWQQNGSGTYTATAQVDDDPAIEVFTAGTSSIRAYDSQTGEREWQRNLTNARIRATADADDGARVDLYLGRVGGAFLTLDAQSGETEWSTRDLKNGDTIVPLPVLGDVDDDARPEVVRVLNSGIVAILDPETGAELALYERTVPV